MAVHLAAKYQDSVIEAFVSSLTRKITGFILDNTFQSLSYVITQWLPTPVEIIDFFNLFNRFKSFEEFPVISEIPVLFLVSGKNRIIWYRQMISLYSPVWIEREIATNAS
jgi:hypothetical protein